MKYVRLLLVVIFTYASYSNSYQCDRRPQKAIYPPDIKEIDRYVIEISGNPKSYTPGENYTISLKSNPSKPVEHRFYEFTLVAESSGKSAGNFHLTDPVLTAFNVHCRNTVIQTNTLTKTKVEVSWEAPPSGSGCVNIKATVFESPESWFIDDGKLTKTLCEEDIENEDIQSKPYCCACNEAKYEVAFQGLWSRNTHPKDFPDDMWKTKLGEIIGASHKYSKSFWNPGEFASEGLKLLAEEGNTTILENELKDMVKNNDVRTIITARELSHPKITGISYTVFRVDQENHLISLVSKITPSPDWIVGVSNLELCLDNCSWIQSRTLNLYPWDVGTDDGITYNSPNLRSNLPQFIREIKSNSPNREESPFYSEEGKPIQPLAKLHLTRLKVYEKECKNPEETSEDIDKCDFGEWNEWSSCSVTCGKGVKTRDRPLLQSSTNYEACLSDPNVIKNLQETVICDTNIPCDGLEDESEDPNDCPNSEWGPWTECSVTCGSGIKTRMRQEISDDNNGEISEDYEDDNQEEESEDRCKRIEKVECSLPPCTFNNISSEGLLIYQSPHGKVIDCKVSKWSIWGPCDTSQPCKKRYKIKQRQILIHPQNGGKPCPRKLQRKKKCGCKKVKLLNTQPISEGNTSAEKAVDCELSSWSPWSPCSSTCGRAVQQRTRLIKVAPSKNGKPCGKRIQQRICRIPVACNGGGIEFFT